MTTFTLVVISIFLKFHLKLVLKNTTTIENLDKSRNITGSAPALNVIINLKTFLNIKIIIKYSL